jgi:hypothetical protein
MFIRDQRFGVCVEKCDRQQVNPVTPSEVLRGKLWDGVLGEVCNSLTTPGVMTCI